jgi:hypothetical protein
MAAMWGLMDQWPRRCPAWVAYASKRSGPDCPTFPCLLLRPVCMVQATKDRPGNHLHIPVAIGAEPLHKSDNT